MHLPVSTQTLALLALLFSVVSNAINTTTLVKKITAAWRRRIGKELGLRLPPEPDPRVVPIGDVESITLKPPR